MTKRRFLLALAAFQIILILVMLLAPVWYARAVTASYNMTVRIVNSAGTVLDGVASAVTANYNQTVRVVDSNGNVIDAFSSPQPTPAGGYPLTVANGGTGSTTLDGAHLNQSTNTEFGNYLGPTISGLTFGVENTGWSFTMPANYLGPYGVLQCHVSGDLTNNTGGTVLYKVKDYVGTTLVDSSNTGLGTLAVPRLWSTDFRFWNVTAANLNFTEGTWFWGGTQSVAGVGSAVAFTDIAAALASTIDTSQPQTVKVVLVAGAPTSGATPTPSPTAGTTPIAHFYGGYCFKVPPVTPTPTPTPTPTETPAPTETQTPTPSPT